MWRQGPRLRSWSRCSRGCWREIKGAYLAAGITTTLIAFPSSFSAAFELPRVTSEEPRGEVDHEDPEFPRVCSVLPSGEVVSVDPVLLSRVTKELPSLVVVCC